MLFGTVHKFVLPNNARLNALARLGAVVAGCAAWLACVHALQEQP